MVVLNWQNLIHITISIYKDQFYINKSLKTNTKSMKIYQYFLIIFPLLIFGNPGITSNKKSNLYNLDAYGSYPNYSVNLTISDLASNNGAATGTLSVTNNVLSVNFGGRWQQSVMKTGVIKVLTISPSLPDLELGPILTSANGTPNGYNAKIENNNLVIYYAANLVTSVNTNISVSPSNYATGINYASVIPTIFTCTTGEGSSNGTISIKNGTVNLGITGNWSSSCTLKTGQIMYLNTGVPLQNAELGAIKQGNSDTNYNVKIESNYLVFYHNGASPPITVGCDFAFKKDLGDSSEIIISNDNLYNWVHGVSYDSKGNVISQSRSYFDDLGNPDLSLSKDYVSNKIWGTETTYDNFGRLDKSSLIAPSPLTTFNKTNFLKNKAESTASAYPATLPLNGITTNNEYKASESIIVTGTVSSGLNVTLTAPVVTLSNTFTVTATSGSSFIVTSANLPDVSANPSLANYYSDNNTDEPYQATATHPFAQTNYDSLNPGNVINVVGGNKINGEWKTGYTYTVPSAQEMYYVYGSDYYDGTVSSGKEEVITKFYKSVSIDANGNENVAFTDGEGKLLASARSGGTTSYPVVSLIGTQGFVDVHIPTGISSSQISLIGSSSLYKIYDLKTGVLTTNITGGNTYRIEAITTPISDPKTYIASGAPTYDAGSLGITYRVNYYDYAVNVYNKTGQLIKSIQPNGYVSNTTIVASPAHMTSTNFASTYEYNTLGQLIKTSSPDEGVSKFAYRNDGQIRYSQSALQVDINSSNPAQRDTKVSYTDYDTLGRPIESGVITGSSGIWAIASSNPDAALIAGTRSEQIFTVYDYSENNTTSVTLPTTPTNLTLAGVLATAGISSTNYTQNNLSGNVAITYTKPGTTISAITWYSYDLYGRTEWIVQYNEGIGGKTIHYEYDYKGNVKKVLFQKDKTAELFVHQYTYNANDVLTKVETSTNNSTFTTHADYTYYKTGELKRINIGQGTQGLDYVYTLGGQLKSINHPSLESAKDPGGDGLAGSSNAAVAADIFGLTLDYYKGDYLRTGRNITSSPTAGADYIGNIKASRWANKAIAGDYSGSTANQKAYLYNYNRNNWLTGATFGNADTSTAIITPSANLSEGGLTYDANGNIKTLIRTDNAGRTIDNLTYSYGGNNQLNKVSDSGFIDPNLNDIRTQTDPQNYKYDAIGQLTDNVSENLNYIYNTEGLVTEVKKNSTSLIKFFYNDRGQRIRKESYGANPSTTYYSLDLSGNAIAIYTQSAGGSITQSELPVYGLSRLGVSNRSSITNYEITDHLGNVRAVVQRVSGNTVTKSYADYYPFGEVLYGRNSFDNYRYAFQGQELDQDTQMEAFKLRLWDGRIGRWLSTDPYGQYASPYLGMGNNPVSSIDPDGGWARWLGAAWHALWNGGTVFKSEVNGDWGVRSGTISSDGNGMDINTTFGGKRYNNNSQPSLNFGGAGAGGMSLYGLNINPKHLPDVYMEGHVAITRGAIGGEVKFLGTRVGLKGEAAKSSLYQIGFDMDSSRSELEGGTVMNTSGISGEPGDSFGGGISYGVGLDAKFDGKTGLLKETTTSLGVAEITQEYHISKIDKYKIKRTKVGLNLGAEASFFFGIEASFKAGVINPGKK